MLKYIGMVLVAAVLSMGASCQSSFDTTKIDAAIHSQLPRACQLAATGFNTFKDIVETGTIKVSANLVRNVNAAYAGVWEVCQNPNEATAASSLVAVGRAYAVITSAIKSAKGA